MLQLEKDWIDFSFLFVLGSFHDIFPNYQPEKVLWILLALILNFCVLLLKEKIHPLWLVVGVFLFCLGLPQLLWFLPAIFYFFFGKEWQSIDWIFLLFIFALFYLAPFSMFQKVEGICITLLSVYLAQKNYRFSILKKDLNNQQDLYLEKERAATYQKRQLIEKQNTEINYAISHERNRIARDIHDDVGHLLSSSLMQLGAIRIVNQEDKLEKSLDQLQITLEKSMSNIRNNVHQLYNEDIQLHETLQKICDDFQFCSLEKEFDFNEWMTNEKKLTFSAIIKESLNNVIKHSHATMVKIKLIEHPSFFQLTIKDNGKSATYDTQGLGLLSIKERTQQLNGRTLFEQQKDGFLVSVYIPKGEKI